MSGVFQGAIQGPEEFVEGMALGVKALVGGAVGKLKIIQMLYTYKYYIIQYKQNILYRLNGIK